MVKQEQYLIGWSLFFWAMWLMGLGCLLLFGFFLLLTVDAPLVAAWNGMVVCVEVVLLFKTARHFFCKNKPMSELLLWVGFAALAMPLVATGGCMMFMQTGSGLVLH